MNQYTRDYVLEDYAQHRSTNGAGWDDGDSETHEPMMEDRSLGEVLRDLGLHTQQLVKGEIDLVKTELTDNVRHASKYAAFAVGAAVFSVVALIFMGHLLAQALNAAMPEWAAYLVTTVVFLGVAVGLALAAKKGFEEQPLAPTDSIKSAKEDLEWVKSHK